MRRALLCGLLLGPACGGGAAEPPRDPTTPALATPEPVPETATPDAPPAPPAPPPPSAEATALLAWLEAASALEGERCPDLAAALREHGRARGPRPAVEGAVSLEIDRSETLRTRLRTAVQRILDRTMPCNRDPAVRSALDEVVPAR